MKTKTKRKQIKKTLSRNYKEVDNRSPQFLQNLFSKGALMKSHPFEKKKKNSSKPQLKKDLDLKKNKEITKLPCGDTPEGQLHSHSC